LPPGKKGKREGRGPWPVTGRGSGLSFLINRKGIDNWERRGYGGLRSPKEKESGSSSPAKETVRTGEKEVLGVVLQRRKVLKKPARKNEALCACKSSRKRASDMRPATNRPAGAYSSTGGTRLRKREVRAVLRDVNSKTKKREKRKKSRPGVWEQSKRVKFFGPAIIN